jgi:uncharacterized SAM-binding protein YcdF (DUF218 family)
MTYTQPLILSCAVVALIGLVRSRRCKGALIATVGVLGLALISWPPAAWLFSRPLEAPYRVARARLESLQAIVVLASSVDPPRQERPYPLPDEDTYRRCEFAAWLFRQGDPVPVLASGGRGSKKTPPVSVTMTELLRRAGVPDAMIWTEEQSLSTHENAIYSAEILRRHGISRIALVVDAQSMRRAEASFRKQGITVIPAPSSYVQSETLSDYLIPSWRAIQQNEITLHETIGLVWYWLRGWI